MSLNIGKVKQFSKDHPEDLVKDYDKMYDEIKERYAAKIKAGKLGFDDRTKLFHMAITDDWTEWLIVTYNQCRLGICCGCAGTAFGSSQQLNQTAPPPYQGPPSNNGWWSPQQGPLSGGWWPPQQGPLSGGWWPPQQGPLSGGWGPTQGPPSGGYWWCPPQSPPLSGWCPPQGPPPSGGCPPQVPTSAGEGGKPNCGCKQ